MHDVHFAASAEIEDGSEIGGSPIQRRPVESTVQQRQGGHRIVRSMFAPEAASEVVEQVILAPRGYAESRPASVASALSPAVQRRAAKGAVKNGQARGTQAVMEILEAIERVLPTGTIRAEDGSAIATTAACRSAVQRAHDVDEARIWAVAVRLALEAVEHGLRAGPRDREERSATPTCAAVRAPSDGRAIERTADVDETRIRERAVSRPAFEAVEHAVGGTHVRWLRRESGRRWAQGRAVSAAAAREHCSRAHAQSVAAKI